MMSAEDRRRIDAPAPSLPSRKGLPPFDALRAFDAIARLGGVRRAAQYLCRDHGVISRHLRTVEEWTGTKLIARTAAGTVLTEDGKRYHKQIMSAIDTISNATIDLMKRGDSRRLHIHCMPAFALHWISGRLGDFEQANPGFDIEVRPMDRSPDFLTHHADVDLRIVAMYGGGTYEVPAECRSMEIARAPVIAVASREYLARNPKIREPRDILGHQLLHEDNLIRWRNWLASHEVHTDVELSGPRLWQAQLTLEAARHGRGIALINHLVVAEELQELRLVDIGAGLPSFQPPAMGMLQFVARAERWDALPIRSFREWLTSTIAKDHPELTPPSSG